ncbi:MAG: ROK family protein [Verrucomicrobiota bacterium]
MSSGLFAAIEAGGTKFNCAIGRGPGDLRATTRIPTTSPRETIEACLAFFTAKLAEWGKPAAVGIASFGPLDLRPGSPTYGSITKTPKAGWSHVDLVTPFALGLGVPAAIDTDVNGAALAEGRWGAAQGLRNFIYLTVGTGIGGGAVVNGQLVHGLIHPEMGHVRPIRHPRDSFHGVCAFHGDCLEGLASGPAMQGRWGRPASELPVGHEGWSMEADYLAQALVSYICVLSPERIILGGGVVQQKAIFPLIRQRVAQLLNDYIDSPAVTREIDSFIVPAALGDHAGVLGGIALAASTTGPIQLQG